MDANNQNKRRKTMRELNVARKSSTKVVAVDERGPGNANHVYEVLPANENGFVLASIRFQSGPLKENAVNGITNEDLIAIVIDRMEGFQSGQYSCKENSVALSKLEEALFWIEKRTRDREERGVEGRNEV